MKKTVRLIAPASPATPEEVAGATEFLSQAGYTVQYGANIFKADRFLAAGDALRAHDVEQAFCDPETDIIMALKGGYGSARMLDQLNYDLIRKNPKPFFGFSDITALQTALFKKTGLPSFTGFNAGFLFNKMTPLLSLSLKRCLAGEDISLSGLTPFSQTPFHSFDGILWAGTLTLLANLCGTGYLPDFKNKILILEDVGEEPYRIDRLLTQLRQNGVFDHLTALLFGRFHLCFSKDPQDGSLSEVISDHFENAPFPVLTDFPYGHKTDHLVFPIGTKASFNADKQTFIIQNDFPSLKDHA